jgi:hypothetical protein
MKFIASSQPRSGLPSWRGKTGFLFSLRSPSYEPRRAGRRTGSPFFWLGVALVRHSRPSPRALGRARGAGLSRRCGFGGRFGGGAAEPRLRHEGLCWRNSTQVPGRAWVFPHGGVTEDSFSLESDELRATESRPPNRLSFFWLGVALARHSRPSPRALWARERRWAFAAVRLRREVRRRRGPAAPTA